MPRTKAHLSEKEQAFVNAKLSDPSVTDKDAAIAAGYSRKSAKFVGHEVANRPRVKAVLDARRQQAAEKADTSAAWVLQMARENALRAMQHVPVLDKDGNETGEYRYEGAVANGALTIIGKANGMFEKTVRIKFDDAEDALRKLRALPREERIRVVREMLGAE